MPDWTYHPLRRLAAGLLGERRSLRVALRLLAAVAGLPAGHRLTAGFGHSHPPPGVARRVAGRWCPTPVGASVGVAAADAVAALPPLGAGLIEIGPLPAGDASRLARRLRRRRGGALVALRSTGEEPPEALARVAPHVDLLVVAGTPPAAMGLPILVDGRPERLPRGCAGVVLRGATCQLVAEARRRLPNATVVAVSAARRPATLVALLDAGADVSLTTAAGLVEAGPGVFQRVVEAIAGRDHPEPPRIRDVPRDPRRWPGWIWGTLFGLGMIATGLGAAAVTIGPVLLWYDRTFLGMDTAGLAGIDPRLVRFLQHDRISLAGTVAAIGVLAVGLSAVGIRRGWGWARDALLASGAVGFPTLLYVLRFHYLEPVHIGLAALLCPVFLAAVWRRPATPHWTTLPEGGEPARRRALVGQLLLVLAGVGMIGAGLVMSLAGLTTVFVPSDLTFMATTWGGLAAANPRLPGFIAHDRAGLGGALLSVGVGTLLLTAWGWRRGESWVWWTLLASAAVELGAALGVHLAVGYLDFWHLLPVYVGILLVAAGLVLSRPYLCASAEHVGDPSGAAPP